MKIEINRDDERKLWEAYETLDKLLNGHNREQENEMLKKALKMACEKLYDLECCCPFRHDEECKDCEWAIGKCESYTYRCMAIKFLSLAKEEQNEN